MNRKIWVSYIVSTKTLVFKVCSFNEARKSDFFNCNFYHFSIYAYIILRFTDKNSLEIISSNFSRVELSEIDKIYEQLKKKIKYVIENRYFQQNFMRILLKFQV